MNNNSTPSWEDYRRLRRALLGFLLLLLALILGGVASMLPSSYNPIAEVLFGLLYCLVPIACIVALLCTPLTPQSDPKQERFVKGSIRGRRACVLFGVGLIGWGLLAFVLIDRAFSGDFLVAWLIAVGLSNVVWSFQFPKVAQSEQLAQEAKRWQFSLRTLLMISLIVALYLAAAVWLSQAEEHIAWRLLKPFAILGLLSTAVWFVVTFVVIPIRWTCITVAKLLRRPPEATDADSN